MKLNLVVKTSKNFQGIEISATDVEVGRLHEIRNSLIKEATIAINMLVPDNAPVQTYVSEYKPASNPGGALASQKQVNFCKALGYEGDCTGMTVTEADAFIKAHRNK